MTELLSAKNKSPQAHDKQHQIVNHVVHVHKKDCIGSMMTVVLWHLATCIPQLQSFGLKTSPFDKWDDHS